MSNDVFLSKRTSVGRGGTNKVAKFIFEKRKYLFCLYWQSQSAAYMNAKHTYTQIHKQLELCRCLSTSFAFSSCESAHKACLADGVSIENTSTSKMYYFGIKIWSSGVWINKPKRTTNEKDFPKNEST